MQVITENKVVPKLRFGNFSNSWDISKFDTYCNFQQGVQVDVELHKKKYEDGYIKFLRIENYTQKSNDFRFIPDLYKESKRIDEDDIVVVRYGATAGFIGRGFTGILANNLFKIIPDKNIFNKDYLYQYLISFRVFKFFQSEMAGGAMPALSFGIVKHLKVPITSIPEQQKIASFLSAVDEKLQQLTKKKELLEEYKKGVMQKIFSQELRFKDDNGNSYSDWEEKRIEDLFIVTRGTVLAIPKISTHKINECPYPVYSSQTKNNGIAGYYKDYLFEDAITWTTDGAQAGEVNFRKGKFYCTNVCGVLKSDEGYANLCIAEKLNRVSRRYVSYVGNPKLMNNVMAKIRINIPTSLDEQKKLSNFLSSLDSKMELVSTQIENTKVFKKGLLQQMFV